MRMLSVYVLMGVLTAFTQGQSTLSAAGASGVDLSAVARRYLSAERERQVEGATQSTVEAALAFLTETVVYEHPRAGARIEGKTALREGMRAFLGSVRSPRDEVLSTLAGPGVVVAELRQSFEVRRNAGWESQTRRVVKVLEFDGEMIKRIIDYW